MYLLSLLHNIDIKYCYVANFIDLVSRPACALLSPVAN